MKVFAVFDSRGAFVRVAANEQNAIAARPENGEHVGVTMQRNEAQSLWSAECKNGVLLKRDIGGWEFSAVKDAKEETQKTKSLNKQKKVDDSGDET